MERISMISSDTKYDLTNSARKLSLKESFAKVFKVDKRNIWGKALPIAAIVGGLLGGFAPGAMILFMPIGLLAYGIGKNVENKLNNSFRKSGAEELTSIAFDIRGEDALNVNTNANLLQLSKEQKRIYNITLNENKLPVLLQTKLINVPVYTRTGEVDTVPMVQEHAIGSKVYTLSRTR